MLRKVYAILEDDAKDDVASYDLTPEQDALLDEHLELYEKGQMKFSPWDEVEKRIISRAKNPI